MKVVATLAPTATLLGALVPGALSEEPAVAVGLHKNLAGVAKESAELTDEDVPDTFEPAVPLDFFRNIDESKFKWMDKDEIRPGETTCGFLKAPLGWPNGSDGWHEADDDVIFSTVSVYVCVKFAKVQPAPRGNLAVHCGGPGELSACVYEMELGDAQDTYNAIGFDQRGMGRSKPTFIVKECDLDSYDECDYDASKATEEEVLHAEARCHKARILGCWKYPGFQLESEDDSDKMHHFLEYSGTRQLAEDIERVRILFGEQKLSIYGVSYGTKVMGTYATIFPENVGLMVLDANGDPGSDAVSNAEDIARRNNQRIDYFIASCEFSSACHVPNIRGCINRLGWMFDANWDDLLVTFESQVKRGPLMQFVIQLLFSQYDQVDGICEAAEEGDYEQVKAIVQRMLMDSGPNGDGALLQISPDDFDQESKPTLGSDDWPFDNYYEMAESIAAALVHGQDYAFGAYDEDIYVRSKLEWRDKYSGAGTRVGDRGSWYGLASYYFPNVTPLAPIGNPQVRGIIAGQIYDPLTPYIWTQKTRERFPLATLLTSRSVNHGMSTSMIHGTEDPVCHEHIQRYFQTGEVGINDGHVCESESIGDSCTINEILEGALCGSKANGGGASVKVSTE